MLKSAGEGVVLLMVSLPVLVLKVQEYEFAFNVVPVLSCRATSVANVVPSKLPEVNPTFLFVETFAVEISST